MPPLRPGPRQCRPLRAPRRLDVLAAVLLVLVMAAPSLVHSATASLSSSSSSSSSSKNSVRGDENAQTQPSSMGFESSDVVDALSFEPPYVGDDLHNRYFDFGGDAIIDINRVATLTRQKSSSTGWIWSLRPLNMDHWEVTLEFKIYSESEPLVGDGLAIWFDESPIFQPGPVMGMRQRWNGFGTFVDIFNNHIDDRFENQIIAGFNSHGDLEYNKSTDGNGQDVGRCGANIVGRANKSKLRISYSNTTGVSVHLLEEDVYSGDSENSVPSSVQASDWKLCFNAPNVRISSNSHIGVTANTGMLAAVHDVYSLQVVRRDGTIGAESMPLHNAPKYTEDMLENKDKDRWGDTSSDSTGMSLGRMLLVIVVCCAVLYAIYSIYRVKMQRDLRRF